MPDQAKQPSPSVAQAFNPTDALPGGDALNPKARLDSIMEELGKALGASEETVMLSVDKQESGYWTVSTPEGESLDFNGTMSENEDLLVVTLFRDEAGAEEFGEVDEDGKQLLSIKELTLRDAVAQVVNQIGYGDIEDILSAHHGIGARAEREGLVPAGFELTKAHDTSLQMERKDHTELVYISAAGADFTVRAFRDDRPADYLEVRASSLETAIKAGKGALDNWDAVREKNPSWFKEQGRAAVHKQGDPFPRLPQSDRSR